MTKRSLIFTTYLLAVFYGLSFWGKPIYDPDLGWHLLGGAWIIKHGNLPAYDFINGMNSEWHDYHWLAQLALGSIYNAGGFELLRLCLGIILASLFKIILDICYIASGSRKSPLLVTVFFAASALLISYTSTVRPQIIALTLLALVVRRLVQKKTPWELTYLVGLTILLVNIHVYWIFVPFLYGCYRVIPALLRKRNPVASPLAGTVVLLLCGLASPYGVQSYLLLFEYATMPALLRNTIKEFKNPFSLNWYPAWILLVYLITLARLFHLKRALVLSGMSLTAIAAPFIVLKGVKFLPVFALLGLPFMLRFSGRSLRKYAPNLFAREPLAGTVTILGVFLAALFACWNGFPWREAKTGVLYSRYPIEICEKLPELLLSAYGTTERHLRVLTHFNHGGWCRWAMYQKNPDLDVRVTTDGRTQGVPEERFKKGFELYQLRPGWAETLRAWAPDASVVPVDSALGQYLLAVFPDRAILKDDTFMVYLSPLPGRLTSK